MKYLIYCLGALGNLLIDELNKLIIDNYLKSWIYCLGNLVIDELKYWVIKWFESIDEWWMINTAGASGEWGDLLRCLLIDEWVDELMN